MTGKKLRAVGYCRTSSESQRDNTSIPSQKEAIERFASQQGWQLVGWYVDESKSGSKIEGREQFQKMMKDAARDPRPFDVVTVYDVTRFGRNGMDILDSSRTLARDFGVHVLDTKGSFDTRDNRRTLPNFIHAGVAEDERLRILERTKRGKIAKAKAGAKIGTWNPFGRKWDKATQTWEVIADKQAMIEDASRRYISGEQLPELAEEFGISYTQLRVTLLSRSGDVWLQRVRCKELGIEEVIPTPVPRLLSEETIKAVRATAAANTNHMHGQAKNQYLIGRMVFCSHCGYALFGTTPAKDGVRYYRHSTGKRLRGCEEKRKWIRAEHIEDAVIRHLFEMFGNPVAVRNALDAANPNMDDVEQARERLERIGKELEKTKSAKQRIIRSISNDTLTEEEASDELAALRKTETRLKEESESLATRLANVPTKEQADQAAKKVSAIFKRYNRDLDKMTWDERRKLCQMVFGGKLSDGRRMGVYIGKMGPSLNKRYGEGWRYSILGHLIEDWGRLQATVDGVEFFDFGHAPLQGELGTVTRVGLSRPAAGPPTPPTSSGTLPCCRGEAPSARPPGAAAGRARTTSRTSPGRP